MLAVAGCSGSPADLLVDGTISGDYRVEGNKATFSGREHWLGHAHRRIVEGVGVDGGRRQGARSNGEAGLSCANDALIVTPRRTTGIWQGLTTLVRSVR